jgi:hypothetical protein
VKFCIKRLHVVCVAVLLVITVSALNMRRGVCFASSGDAPLLPTFVDADAALKRAFVAVSDAEAAGANVSGLLAELDVAGRNLTEAEMVYAAGNVSDAASRADQCVALADAVAGEALNLKGQAVENGRTASWHAVTFSLVGIFTFLVVLVLVWVLFRRSYSGRMLSAKPEVAAQ